MEPVIEKVIPAIGSPYLVVKWEGEDSPSIFMYKDDSNPFAEDYEIALSKAVDLAKKIQSGNLETREVIKWN